MLFVTSTSQTITQSFTTCDPNIGCLGTITTDYFPTVDFLQFLHFNLSAVLWIGAICIFLLTIILVLSIYE